MPDTDGQQDVQRGDRGSTPTPDPTVLTTEALQREVAALRELVEQRIDASREAEEQRLNGVEGVLNEKLASIDTQLDLIERQRVEQKKDTKDAVDAALSAAKEAVKEQTTASEARTDKSETSMIKSIEELGKTIGAELAALRRESGDLKSRIGTVEARKQGATEQREVANLSQGTILAYIIAAAAVVGAIVAIAGGP